MYGDDELPLLIGTSTSFHQDPVASEVLGSQMNPAFFAFYPDMAFDSWLTIGLDGPPSENEGEPLTIGNSNNNWKPILRLEDVVMADAIGGSVFILNAPNITNNISGEDHRILLGQFTTDGELEGQVNVQMFTQGIINPSDRDHSFSGVGCIRQPCWNRVDAWMRRPAITIRWPIVTTAAALPWTQSFRRGRISHLTTPLLVMK